MQWWVEQADVYRASVHGLEDSVEVLSLIRQQLLERLLALAERDDIVKGAQELLVERPCAEVGLLLDIADSRRLIELYRAAVILLLAEQAAHERRLAGTICPDKADLVAARDLETDIVEELVDAE